MNVLTFGGWVVMMMSGVDEGYHGPPCQGLMVTMMSDARQGKHGPPCERLTVMTGPPLALYVASPVSSPRQRGLALQQVAL